MSKTLYLHPGSPKGGSTWIQDFCIKNRQNLEIQNFEYIHDFRELDFECLMGDNHSAFFNGLDNKILKKLPQNSEKVFLSYENVLGDPLFKEGLFAMAPTIAKNLTPINNSFSKTVVIWIYRPIGSLLLSVYNQRKKQGAKLTFENFTSMIEQRDYDSRFLIEALRVLSQNAEIHVFNFSDLQARPKRFLRNFFNLMHTSLDENFDLTSPQRNPSVREEGLKVLEFAKDVLDQQEYNALRQFMQAKMPKTEYSKKELAFLESHKQRFESDDTLFKENIIQGEH